MDATEDPQVTESNESTTSAPTSNYAIISVSASLLDSDAHGVLTQYIVDYSTDKSIDKNMCEFKHMTRNEGIYKSLLAAIRQAKEAGIEHVRIYTESGLVKKQIDGDWVTGETVLTEYVQEADELLTTFDSWEIKQKEIPTV